MHNQQMTTWLDHNGRPLLEMSLGGVMISALESRFVTERYLTQAALNKDETLIDFSLIRSNRQLHQPEAITALTVHLAADDSQLQIPSDSRRWCTADGSTTVCRIRRQDGLDPIAGQNPPAAVDERYLLPSNRIPVYHPK